MCFVPNNNGEGYALLVGVDYYEERGHYKELKYASDDVEFVKDTLVQIGFKDDVEHINVLTTAGGDFPSSGRINAMLEQICEKVSPKDSLLIMFAGHGYEVNGEAFFAPFDALSGNFGKNFEKASVSIDEVIDRLSICNARYKWLVVDACRLEAEGVRGEDNALGIGELEARQGVVIFQSCKSDELSVESDLYGHGLFTQAFSEALLGAACSDDSRELLVSDIGQYVMKRTNNLAEVMNHKQNPCISYGDSDFIVRNNICDNLFIQGLTPEQIDLGVHLEQIAIDAMKKRDFYVAKAVVAMIDDLEPSEGAYRERWKELKSKIDHESDAFFEQRLKKWKDDAVRKGFSDVVEKFRGLLIERQKERSKKRIEQELMIIESLEEDRLKDQKRNQPPRKNDKNVGKGVGSLKNPQYSGPQDETDYSPFEVKSRMKAKSINGAGAIKAGSCKDIRIGDILCNFCYCPPGKFMMGSPDNEEWRGKDERWHEVTLTRGFWMAETQATQAFWQAIMKENPSHFNKGGAFPVDSVSLYDCLKFVRRLNEGGYAWEGYQFGIPTEAQWEYACRAGGTGAYGAVRDAQTGYLEKMGWYSRNSHRSTHEVKSSKLSPNLWGLYDMHGNLYEWCSDAYEEDYPSSAIDPVGTLSYDGTYVFRGGKYSSRAPFCRCAARGHGKPETNDEGLGFRLILVETERR